MTHQHRCISLILACPLLFGPLGCDSDKTSSTSPAGDEAAASEDAQKASDETEEVEAIALPETLELGGVLPGDAGKPYAGLKVKAPAGCETEADADQTMVMIACGDRKYSLAVEDDETKSVETVASSAKKTKLDELHAAYVDESDAFAWSWSFKGADPNHSFVADVQAAGTTFRCTNKGFGSFDRAHNEAMLKSCQSLSK